ncbi:helix-turn-helix domain-containing protein [Phytoactinopolyspora mesophila]|uniref:Helix-turn-helix domain-containing protein n=1 Tax=Phytoactinopolyspora mesophila TaxID=2650750 RepID=A0A7K3LZY1_9ACTN|nr:AraC family transcriptional regulator [Phytoactinopolyspora mesophila]NDL56593.1 helix-turn-helix domain-containing protein [Phytoactinopolyspora mesophila]
MPSARAQRDVREVGGAWTGFQRHWFADAHPDLAPFVERYWFVAWDLRDQPPYRQLVVPYPNVHLTFFNDTTAAVHGVTRGHVVRVLEGAGRVFGAAFRPGCFRPFLRSSASAISDVSVLTGRSVPAQEILGPDVPLAAMAAAEDETAMRHIMDEFLRAILPADDASAQTAAAVVAHIADDPHITRVDQLADQVNMSVRGLQRLFAEYVGVGPKWVIRRYRLHEVSVRLDAGIDVDWSELAAELGYADQAHFTRDFTAIVGESPTRYAQRYPAPPRRSG